MKLKTMISGCCAAILLLAGSSLSAEQADEAAVQAIALKVRSIAPQLQIQSITPSEMDGLYQVVMSSGEYLFMTADTKHFVVGDLYRANDEGLVNLSDLDRNDSRREKMAAIEDKDKIIFTPKETKATVMVFTDVTCGYCQKLHSQIEDYLALGIEIQYLAYPRAGIGSDAYNDMVSAWCADDRQAALTKLKSGQSVDSKTCDNPVASEYTLGGQVGVNGTPALVLESGELVPGYLPPQSMAELLGI